MSMNPLTAALLISNRQLWEQTHNCIQALPVRIAFEQNDITDVDELVDRVDRLRADVVLLEALRLPVPLEEFVRRLQSTVSQPAVFVLHLEASPQHILEALRAGASEYLHPPLTESLRKAFERLSVDRARSSLASAGALGRVFGFISAKGGCGATTFACHVATETARQLARQVLLADFDFDASLLRFIMKAKATYSLRDALDNLHRMDSSYWKALISTQNHLDVITAPDDLTAKRPGDAKETVRLMRFVRSIYPAIIVDFGRHVSGSALHALPEVDTLYIVTTLAPDDLDHARDCVEMVEEREFPRASITVVVNGVPDRGARDVKSVESLLGIAPGAWFPADAAALYDAWSQGHLLAANSKLGRELNGLAASIVARVLGTKSEPKSGASSEPAGVKRIFSFFQRALA